MKKLTTTPNIVDPDGLYAELLALHDGREEDESHAINARLVLILANHIGDRDVLRQAFALAAPEHAPNNA
ncbi:MAG: DUF2783 domain-containing protein [Hyphomicrobiaceae bacterium]